MTDTASSSPRKKNYKNPYPPQGDVSGRTPPHHPEAERGVLAAIINDFELDEGKGGILASLLVEGLAPDWFFLTSHQIIAETMVRLHSDRRPCDSLSLGIALKDSGEADAAGGLAYLAELTRGVSGTAFVHAHFGAVREQYLLRRLLAGASCVTESVFSPRSSWGEFSAAVSPHMEGMLGALRATTERRETLADVIERQLRKFDDAVGGIAPDESKLRRVSWGLRSLDERLQPLCAATGDGLVVVGAKPGAGKSSLVRQLAFAHLRSGGFVQAFLLETSDEQFTGRCAGLMSGIPFREQNDAALLAKWRSAERALIREGDAFGRKIGQESLWDFQARVESRLFDERVEAHRSWLRELRAYSDERRLQVRANLNRIDHIEAEARLAHSRSGRTDLIVVDYLQEVIHPDPKLDGHEKIGDICRRLRALGKELGAVVFLICSLNREVDGMPTRANLRGSGDIEFAADRIVFVHVPDTDANGAKQSDERRNLAVQIRQDKDRDGGKGTLWSVFDRHLTQFIDIPLNTQPRADSGQSSPSSSSGGYGEREERRGRPKGVKNGEGRQHRQPAFSGSRDYAGSGDGAPM